MTAHYILEGETRQSSKNKSSIRSTGPVVAEEISNILQESGIMDKIVAVTVDNAVNMDVEIKRLKFIKLGCFAHTLNLGAQCVYSEKSPTCGQTLPILQKPEKHFTVEEEDTVFVSSIKQAVWETCPSHTR